MRMLVTCAILIASAIGSTASAQEDVTPATTAVETDVTRGVYDRSLTITPRVGVLGYADGNQAYTSRILEGFTANFNLADLLPMPDRWNLGLESGLLFSHIGSPGANFIGTNASVETTAGANSFLVPIYASIGFKPVDRLLVAGNLGTSLVYRSIGSSMYLGRSGDASSGSSVDFFPSLGVNVGWELSRQVALSLRGDLIPTSGTDMFTTTLGATFGLV